MVMVGRTVLSVVFASLPASFFCSLNYGTGHDRIGRFDKCEEIVAVVEQFLHALAQVAWVKLADKNMLDTFLK